MKTMKAILAMATLLVLPALAGRVQAADSGPGVFRFDESSFTIPAGTTVVTVRVERSNGGTGAATVGYSATAGTAAAGTDFVPTSGTLSWASGDQTTKTFNVTIHPSSTSTGKTVQLALANPTGGATILAERGTATLVLPGGSGGGGGDGGGHAGVLRFDEPSFTIPAGTTVVTVRVERSEGETGAVSVGYSATPGTAVAGTDFVPTSGTLSWGNGDGTAKTFNVTLLPASGNAGKTIQLTLANPAGGATILASRGQALLILPGGSGGGGGEHGGGGGAGVLGFDEHDYVAVSTAGKAVITVERSGSAVGAVAVGYTTIDGSALAGKDYTPTSGLLSWAAGDESTKTFFVPLLPNGAGTVKLLLGNPTGGATISPEHGTALLSIGGPGHEDHPPVPPGGPGGNPGTIKFDEGSFQVVAGETATIAVERSGGHAGAVSVQYTTGDGSGVAGTDYTTTTGTLTWGPDQEGVKTFQVHTFANPKGSGKTVRLTLSNPTGNATLGEGKTATLFLLAKNGDTSSCSDDDTTLCTAGGRFRVRVTWRTGDGQTGPGHTTKLNANSGAFWFFSPDNTEMLVKVLDACNGFNSYWVFYAATTNVGFSVEVTDTQTGLVKTYSNPYGLAAPSVNDTGTFATCK
ncbi:MAG: hypothetical protein QOJ16_3452 [Acidobacteriota bacterium]|jgi:hypothetical protein|nr:hypothetical protein [Acidobacteriota bacterium]